MLKVFNIKSFFLSIVCYFILFSLLNFKQIEKNINKKTKYDLKAQLSTENITEDVNINNAVVDISTHFKKKEIANESLCNITFVSAYFQISSKHAVEEYKTWMTNLFSNKMCMVFYYEEDLQVKPKEEQKNTYIFKHVVLSEVAAAFFNRTEEFWIHQTRLDPEIGIHKSYQLYWIWGLKTHFLEEVALSNPFQSEVFFWFDAGYIRSDKYTYKDWLKLQVPLPMKKHKGIFILRLAFYTEKHKKVNEHGKIDWDFSSENHLGGGAFGGNVDSIRHWSKLYKDTFQYYTEINRFLGKDQSLFSTMCLTQLNMCRFVDPDPNLNDIWFGMIPFITGDMQ